MPLVLYGVELIHLFEVRRCFVETVRPQSLWQALNIGRETGARLERF